MHNESDKIECNQYISSDISKQHFFYIDELVTTKQMKKIKTKFVHRANYLLAHLTLLSLGSLSKRLKLYIQIEEKI